MSLTVCDFIVIMPPRRGRGRRGGRGAAEPESQIDRIERIIAGLAQVVQDAHSNTADQPAAQVPRAEAVVQTTIRQFQQLRPPTFKGTPDPMAAESWLLGIERVFEMLPCTDEQKVAFGAFTFEGAALVWWTLKKATEQHWLWPRFLEVFNEEYFPNTVRDLKTTEFLSLTQGDMSVAEYNAKFVEQSRYAPRIISSENCKAMKFETGLWWKIRNQ